MKATNKHDMSNMYKSYLLHDHIKRIDKIKQYMGTDHIDNAVNYFIYSHFDYEELVREEANLFTEDDLELYEASIVKGDYDNIISLKHRMLKSLG